MRGNPRYPYIGCLTFQVQARLVNVADVWLLGMTPTMTTSIQGFTLIPRLLVLLITANGIGWPRCCGEPRRRVYLVGVGSSLKKRGRLPPRLIYVQVLERCRVGGRDYFPFVQ